MGMKRADETPVAIVKANAYAEIAMRYGLTVTIKVVREEAEYYSHGGVMLPARVHAWVTVRDEWVSFWGDTIYGGWSSVLPGQRGSEGRLYNATTRWLGGDRYAPLGTRRDLSSERTFASEIHNYSYRLREPAKYDIESTDR